jgi:hypothetical protein
MGIKGVQYSMTGTVMWRREPGSAGLDLGPFRVLAEANRLVRGVRLERRALVRAGPRDLRIGPVISVEDIVRMRRASDGEHTSYLVDLELIQTA